MLIHVLVFSLVRSASPTSPTACRALGLVRDPCHSRSVPPLPSLPDAEVPTRSHTTHIIQEFDLVSPSRSGVPTPPRILPTRILQAGLDENVIRRPIWQLAILVHLAQQFSGVYLDILGRYAAVAMKTPSQKTGICYLVRASVLVRVLCHQLYQIHCLAEILLATLTDKKVNDGAVCGGIGLYTHHA